ncbi:MAG: hypothetical protein IPO77_19810 [Acidobacteria bacterium]|nr:hypothetical protein [Acidobacteriota bacterium]
MGKAASPLPPRGKKAGLKLAFFGNRRRGRIMSSEKLLQHGGFTGILDFTAILFIEPFPDGFHLFDCALRPDEPEFLCPLFIVDRKPGRIL